MATKLQFTFRDGNNLDTIILDATLTERHSYQADVTESPVEKGANVSDNIRAKPDVLSIEGFIADFPLANDGRSKTNSAGPTAQNRPPSVGERSKNALAQLRRLQTEGVLITVSTAVTEYKSMCLQSCEVSRNSKLGAGIPVSLVLKQINQVETKRVQVVRAKENKGKPKVKEGKKDKQLPTTAEESKAAFAKDLAFGAMGIAK